MGWTTCYTAKHYKWVKGRQIVDRKACCDALYTWENKDENGTVIGANRVLKSTMVGSVWYGAVESIRPLEGSRKVWAGVCLTCGKSRHDGTIWGYKDMDECGEPFYYECPPSILALLTPPTCERAEHWRNSCREWAAKKKKLKAFTLPPGITCHYRGGWVVSSEAYRQHYGYSGVRYRRSCDKQTAVRRFVESYGTPEQKAAWLSANQATNGASAA